MYNGIKNVGRFVRGLVNPNYRSDCYYAKFSNEWRGVHKNTLEGMEVEARIHHRDESTNDCSLVNWVLSLEKYER
jgi:hypothetical protein